MPTTIQLPSGTVPLRDPPVVDGLPKLSTCEPSVDVTDSPLQVRDGEVARKTYGLVPGLLSIPVTFTTTAFVGHTTVRGASVGTTPAGLPDGINRTHVPSAGPSVTQITQLPAGRGVAGTPAPRFHACWVTGPVGQVVGMLGSRAR
ncbi:MAG TPA: hypothetical protein PKB06_05410, partial [Actinotalea sp.]|nr:hypothetical protein [Actinotalea sp.]